MITPSSFPIILCDRVHSTSFCFTFQTVTSGISGHKQKSLFLTNTEFLLLDPSFISSTRQESSVPISTNSHFNSSQSFWGWEADPTSLSCCHHLDVGEDFIDLCVCVFLPTPTNSTYSAYRFNHKKESTFFEDFFLKKQTDS